MSYILHKIGVPRGKSFYVILQNMLNEIKKLLVLFGWPLVYVFHTSNRDNVFIQV
jgi:hypothetical protein